MWDQEKFKEMFRMERRVALGAILGGVIATLLFEEPTGAPQQAVQWVMMCFYTVFPYCILRVLYMPLPPRELEETNAGEQD